MPEIAPFGPAPLDFGAENGYIILQLFFNPFTPGARRMERIMYQMENEVPFTRTGADGRLKLHEAVAMMMDCCQFQEYQEQTFCRYLRENNLAVFLFSIQLDVIRLPRFREKVRTAVKIYGCKSIYGLRRITMRDESGELCIISNATGAFFDVAAGRAAKIDPAVFGVVYDEAEPMECLPRKIPVPAEGGVPMPVFVVKPSDLDGNGHLTSPLYFAIAGDVLPADFAWNRVRAEFRKQAKPGETVHPVLYLADGAAVVDLRDDDGVSFAVTEFTSADLGSPSR